jgi:hypothetical protein
MSRAKRIDTNQTKIVRTLRQVPGVSVAVTSRLGDGFPDLVVAFKGRNYLFEIKDPARPPSERRLTEAEAVFFKNWTGCCFIATESMEILKFIEAIE